MNVIGFADRKKIKHPKISIQAQNIGGDIEILPRDEIRLGNSVLNIDKRYIVELIIEGGSRVRLSGPAGRKNLECYKESLMKSVSETDDAV